MNKIIFAIALFLLPAFTSQGVQAAVPMHNATDSASCAIAAVMGPLINNNLVKIQGLGVELDRDVFVRALAEYLDGGNPGFSAADGDAYIEARVRALHATPPDTLDARIQRAYVARMAKTDGALTLPTGSVLITLREGEGPTARDGQKVRMGYSLRLSDGTVLDDTLHEPVEMGVNEVTPGFADGLRHMRAGGKYRLVVPAEAGYGKDGISHVVPGNAALDFIVELHSISD